MVSRIKESTLVAKMRAILERAGAYVEKNHGGAMQSAGRPDLAGCWQGRYFGIEVKVPGNKPTALQQFVLDQIRSAGGYAGWTNNVEDVQRMIEHWPYICQQCLGDLQVRDVLEGEVLQCVGCGHVTDTLR